MCFQWTPASGLSVRRLGEEGSRGCRDPRRGLRPALSVELRQDSRGARVCALAPGFGFGPQCLRALAPNLTMRFSQRRALLRKKNAVCFNFNNTLRNTGKMRGNIFCCILSNKLHTGWHLPNLLDSMLGCGRDPGAFAACPWRTWVPCPRTRSGGKTTGSVPCRP